MINIGDTFDDVLIKPSFSTIESRKDVSVKTDFLGYSVFPLIPSNMDSVTSPEMVNAVTKAGAIGSLHRFMTVEENLDQYYKSIDLMVQSGTPVIPPICSFGIGPEEYRRALNLAHAGAKILLLDVAHGAAIHVVNQYNKVRANVPESIKIIVGNFSDAEGILEFNKHVKVRPNAYKVGIGGGSMCLTRVVTGCGVPTLGSVADCASTGFPIIADGGIRTSGDIAKAFAAGASAVMVGQLLAGTEESPGESVWQERHNGNYFFNKYDSTRPILDPIMEKVITHKKYRGSASAESYEVQGKTASHRAPEGDSTLVPYKGAVGPIIENLEAGVRSALTYVGASNLTEFKERAKFIKVSQNSVKESIAHGKSSS